MSQTYVRPASVVAQPSLDERMDLVDLDKKQEIFSKTNDPEKPKKEKFKRAKSVALKIAKFLFSKVGLVILLSLYAALGAYMFVAIEGEREYDLAVEGIAEAKRIEVYRVELVAEINKVRDCFHKEQGDMMNKALLFPNALDSHIITYMSRRKCRDDQAFGEVRRLINEYHENVTAAIQKYKYSGSVPDNLFFSWTYPSALLFTSTVMTMIGYGHVCPVTNMGKFLVIPYALFGIPLTLIFMGRIGGAFAELVRLVYGQGCCYFLKKKRNTTYEAYWVERDGSLSKRRLDSITDREMIEAVGRKDPHDVLDDELEPVPIILSIGIMLSYIFFGAVLFSLMEGWSLIAGAYFSLVTLTTIGFGDLVPGFTQAGTWTGKAKLLTSVVYIITGLAVLSMGFDLIVNEVMAKARRVGRLAGIVEIVDEDGDGIDDLEEEKLRRRKGNLVAAANKRINDNSALNALMGKKKPKSTAPPPLTESRKEL